MALSKKQRFEIFERDQFTCQYCGQTPPSVVLHVDHIYPVSQGGTDDPENLRTSCQSCNLGKSDKVISDAIANPLDAARRAQEAAEAIQTATIFHDAAQARQQMHDDAATLLCELLGQELVRISSVTSIVRASLEFGPAQAVDWITKAVGVAGCDETNVMKYFHGIIRRVKHG